jgi:hypothetical protein
VENGIIQPLTVRPYGDVYQIVAGERRWRAAKIAGLREVPVRIMELSDEQTMQIALIENLQREDLNPIEEALGYQQLIDTFNMKQEEVAKRVGKARSSGDTFRTGDRVKHMAFGEGTVLSAKAMGADILYEIAFDKVGTKKLMATYAKLTKV